MSKTWTATAPLAVSRYFHTATLLNNGEVLVAGGLTRSSTPGGADFLDISSSELYNATLGAWRQTGAMRDPRDGHTATLLPDGQVLVAGGITNFPLGDLASAELYNPTAGAWVPTGDMSTSRANHTATLLPNGKILVAAGQDDAGTAQASAELYTPGAGTWSPTGALAGARKSHTATLLPTGKVLVTGGRNADKPAQPLASVELYDPGTGKWTAADPLSTPRADHTATLVGGRVLVVGGSTNPTAELYDPSTGRWSSSGSLATARSLHTATLLSGGNVLVAGGCATSCPTSSSEVQLAADLSLTKTDAPDPVVAGKTLTYTLRAANAGPDPAQGVTVRDQLPSEVTFVSASPGCSVSLGVVTCSLGDLAKGASVDRQITVTVPASAAGATLSNTASVQSPTFDPVAANDSAAATTVVTAAPSPSTSADLALTKSDSPDPVQTGQELTYTLSASNAGPDTASGVVLRDQLPAGVLFLRASSGCSHAAATRVVTCNLSNLARGTSAAPVSIVVQPTVANPSLANSATVQSQTADPVSTDNTSTATTNVRALVDLSITKTDAPDPVQTGQELTYRLSASNTGPDTASGVVLRDQLPAGVEFVSAAGCSEAGRVVTCDLGDLAKNAAAASRQIVVRPTEANPALSNTASVQSPAADSNSANDSATASTEVRQGPAPPPPPPRPPTSTPLPAAGSSTPAPRPLPADPGDLVDLPRAAETVRASGLKSCLAAVASHQRLEKSRSKRGSARQRAKAKRHLSRHASSGRRACLLRYARTPGQVTGLTARVLSPTKIALSFNAPGTDGARPPAARSYLLKHSLRGITNTRGFARAQTLCKGGCRFSVAKVGTKLSLPISGLRPHTTYYYAIAARDNVSSRLGPRSQTVKVKTP